MRKALSAWSFILTIATEAFAQGTLDWSIINPAFMTAQTNNSNYSVFGVTGGTPTGGSSGAIETTANAFYFELLYAAVGTAQPTTVSALASWNDAGLTAANSTSVAGRLIPSTETANSSAVVAGWAASTSKNVMLVGWSANLGNTWANVSTLLSNWPSQGGNVVGNAYFGFSTVGTITSSVSNPGSIVFGSTTGLINSPNTQMYLLNVPEPGTMAFAALGGASLLLFRRRK